MSERWGTCKRCRGEGIVLTDKGREVLEKAKWRPGRPIPEVLKDRSNKEYWMECGTCNGEGYDGSAESCPF